MSGNGKPADAASAAVRGVVGALAMTGMRQFAADLGLIEKTPPEELADKPARGLIERVPADRRRSAVLALHFAVAAAGGVGFGMLPDAIRKRGWGGPAWGLAIWLTYELAVEPALGLEPVKRNKALERVMIVGDHLVYGYVLSEARGRSRS